MIHLLLEHDDDWEQPISIRLGNFTLIGLLTHFMLNVQLGIIVCNWGIGIASEGPKEEDSEISNEEWLAIHGSHSVGK
jgi:hypothetical protein